MEVLLIVAVIALLLVLLSYNYLLAVKISRGNTGRNLDDVSGDIGKSQEMSVRAVKAYVLGDYIVVTTVIQRGSSRRSIGEVVIDEPSLLIPLTQSLSENGNLNDSDDKSNVN
ncbi:MAG: hypothetical protein QXO98_01920 [Sulfolobales archaeon]